MKTINLNTKLITVLVVLIFCLQGLAKPPHDRMIVGCDGAYVSIPYGQSSSTSIYTRFDSEVLKYFLTENTNQSKNIEYFLSKKEIQDYILKNDLENDTEAFLNIIVSRPIYIYTNDPVSNYGNFFGGLSQLNNGKEIRMLHNHQENTLNVILYDSNSNHEQVNWVFRNCREPNF